MGQSFLQNGLLRRGKVNRNLDSVLGPKYPLYERIFGFVSRSLMILSGVMCLPDLAPHPFREVSRFSAAGRPFLKLPLSQSVFNRRKANGDGWCSRFFRIRVANYSLCSPGPAPTEAAETNMGTNPVKKQEGGIR
jgi:hypothetical protein